MEQVSYFDIISLSLILLLALKGAFRGFVKEFFGLAGIIGGVFFAVRFAENSGMWLNENLHNFGNQSSQYLVGFLVVFISFWIICIFLGMIVAKMIKLSGLASVDRLGGFALGAAKIFLIFAMIFVAISHVDFIQDKVKKYFANSFMYPIFINAGEMIINIKPNQLGLENKNFPNPKDIKDKLQSFDKQENINKIKEIL